jgi:hypothetical protein
VTRWQDRHSVGQAVEVRHSVVFGKVQWMIGRIIRRTDDGFPVVRIVTSGASAAEITVQLGKSIRPYAPKLRVDLEPDPVIGWQWSVHRGDQTICSGLTDSNKKSVAKREALAAAAIAEAPAQGSAA